MPFVVRVEVPAKVLSKSDVPLWIVGFFQVAVYALRRGSRKRMIILADSSARKPSMAQQHLYKKQK